MKKVVCSSSENWKALHAKNASDDPIRNVESPAVRLASEPERLWHESCRMIRSINISISDWPKPAKARANEGDDRTVSLRLPQHKFKLA